MRGVVGREVGREERGGGEVREKEWEGRREEA